MHTHNHTLSYVLFTVVFHLLTLLTSDVSALSTVLQVVTPYYFAMEDLREDWQRMLDDEKGEKGETETDKKNAAKNKAGSGKVGGDESIIL